MHVFSPLHVGCYRARYGIYSAVARTLPLNISFEPFHWLAVMMQDSLTPNLSRAPIETSLHFLSLSLPPLSLLLILCTSTYFFDTLKVEHLVRLHLSISICFISPLQRHATSSISDRERAIGACEVKTRLFPASYVNRRRWGQSPRVRWRVTASVPHSLQCGPS